MRYTELTLFLGILIVGMTAACQQEVERRSVPTQTQKTDDAIAEEDFGNGAEDEPVIASREAPQQRVPNKPKKEPEEEPVDDKVPEEPPQEDEEPDDEPEPVVLNFAQDIQPIMVKACGGGTCHESAFLQNYVDDEANITARKDQILTRVDTVGDMPSDPTLWRDEEKATVIEYVKGL